MAGGCVGYVWQGACVAGGMHGWGYAWQGSMCGRGACVTGEMATAADGTHPTGMLSCTSSSLVLFLQ